MYLPGKEKYTIFLKISLTATSLDSEPNLDLKLTGRSEEDLNIIYHSIYEP
jgi:hypothetical protein